ncbi:2-oxo acid dehydrogenase subunit E2 [Nocardia barduliensis]|uniref:2-oxo acid dehydrogenase subunit E2 n=1 Tax=Nocardia barduliensis TaxID=2736643 RepID=UPI001572E94D|nr:2-oxo acid dehydrogenase subunit E2 [Nocardia barduliensis]
MTTDQTAVKTTVRMPALGENVEEGTITRWLKAPGDRVDTDEPLLEVATDKVDTEIPSPASGVLDQILVEEDNVVAVGTALAIIAESGADPTEADLPPTPQTAPTTPVAAEPPPPVSAPIAPARSNSSAPEGSTAVTLSSPATAPAPVEQTATPVPSRSGATVQKLPRIRRTIAQRMVESLQTSAQLTTVLEVDVTAVAALRAQHKDAFLARTGVKLSFLPFFAKAAVEALTTHRMLNAALDSEVTEVTYFDHVHLGMAVDSDKGLMVPVIRDAHTLTIAGLAQAIADKAERVRTATITPDELGGGTFTLTNTGSRGALFDTPIINQPQTGILGTGAVVERLVPARRDGNLTIGVRSMAYLSLSYDHRIVDGADAARYLTAVKYRLENNFTASDLA